MPKGVALGTWLALSGAALVGSGACGIAGDKAGTAGATLTRQTPSCTPVDDDARERPRRDYWFTIRPTAAHDFLMPLVRALDACTRTSGNNLRQSNLNADNSFTFTAGYECLAAAEGTVHVIGLQWSPPGAVATVGDRVDFYEYQGQGRSAWVEGPALGPMPKNTGLARISVAKDAISLLPRGVAVQLEGCGATPRAASWDVQVVRDEGKPAQIEAHGSSGEMIRIAVDDPPVLTFWASSPSQERERSRTNPDYVFRSELNGEWEDDYHGLRHQDVLDLLDRVINEMQLAGLPVTDLRGPAATPSAPYPGSALPATCDQVFEHCLISKVKCLRSPSPKSAECAPVSSCSELGSIGHGQCERAKPPIRRPIPV